MSLEHLDAIHRRLTRIIWMLAINIVLLMGLLLLMCHISARLQKVSYDLDSLALSASLHSSRLVAHPVR